MIIPVSVWFALAGILIAYLNSRFVTHDIIRLIGWFVAGGFLVYALAALFGVRFG